MAIIKMFISDLFNSWIDVLDLAVNSTNYIIIPKANIVCRNCGKKQSVIQGNKYISFLCACGCRIYYPPNKEGLIITKFISKEDYEAGKRGK